MTSSSTSAFPNCLKASSCTLALVTTQPPQNECANGKKGQSKINMLKKRALEDGCDDKLFIFEFDNHYKSLVKDSDYFITGSINWLSKRKGKNFERAWKIQIPELAEREFEDCVVIMRPRRLILRRKLIKPFIEWEL